MIQFFLIATCMATRVSVSLRSGSYDAEIVRYGGDVHAKYDRELNETGWNFLTVWSSNFALNHTQRSYAMGFVEGYATKEDIDVYWEAFVTNTWKSGKPPKRITQDLLYQRNYWRESHRYQEPFYRIQEVIDYQFKGLCDGYRRAGGNLTEDDMYLMASRGDLYEILNMCKDDIKKGSFAEIRNRRGKGEIHSCSAFVRNVNGKVFFAHNTWTTYTRMLRIRKVYEYLTDGGAVAIEQTSYPGIFVSIDDFYSVHREKNNWFIMETTNSIYDDKLYTSFVNKHLYWQRVLAALLLGNTTKSMIDNIGKDSSGTYNNQWMIFDNEAWKRENKTGSLMVMEEMRGLVKVHDVTDYLLKKESNYSWTSYNIPYDEDIMKASGFPIPNDCVPHRDARRAIMFRRDISSINSLEDARHYIRYNDYLNDDLSSAVPECSYNFNETENRSPMFAIAARGDLLSTKELYGAIDGKVLTSENPLKMYIVSGPTQQSLKPFKFSDHNKTVPGLPDEFNFDWYETTFTYVEDSAYFTKLVMCIGLIVLFLA